MNYAIIAISSLSLALLLIGYVIANTNMHALAQIYNNNSLLRPNNNTLNVIPPQKEILPLNSQSPVLSHTKKGELDVGHSHRPMLLRQANPLKARYLELRHLKLS